MLPKPKYVSKIFYIVIEDYNLKPLDAMLLTIIHDMATKGTKDYCFIGKSTFSNLLNVTPPTIFKSLDRLEKKGLIKRFQVGAKGAIQPTYEYKSVHRKLSELIVKEFPLQK